MEIKACNTDGWRGDREEVSECWQRPALQSTARLEAHCAAGFFMGQRRETRQREDVSQPQMGSEGGEIKNSSQLTPVC